ncbi:MAG TPA: hypothetical protein VF511_08485, partial [Chthoniobacterales bacterium]
NNTGSSGGLVVTGNGNTTLGGDDSGGFIQHTTATAVLLTLTQSPSFTNLKINNTTGDGVLGTRVTNFTYNNGRMDTNGTAAGESNISFRGDTAGSVPNRTGVVVINGNVLNNARYHGVDIQNYTGTISSADINNNSFTSQTSNVGGTFDSQGSGIRLIAFGTASSHADVTKANINNNIIKNFPVGDGIQVQGGNSSVGGPATVMGVVGNATNIVNINNNHVSGASAAIKLGGNAVVFTFRGTGQANGNIDGNGTTDVTGDGIADPITNILGIGVATGAFGPMNMALTINNNRLVALGNTFASSGISTGLDEHFKPASFPSCGCNDGDDMGTLSIKITNNTVSGHDGNGILVTARASAGKIDAAIKGNNVGTPASGARPGIRVDSGSSVGNTSVCLDIQNNISSGSSGVQGIGLRKQGTVTATNFFGVEGMAATASPGVENYVASLNPSGGGVLLLSATSGFANCSTAPLMAAPEPNAAKKDLQNTPELRVAAHNRDHSMSEPAPTPEMEDAAVVSSTAASSLSPAELDAIVEEAIGQWSATGLTDEQIATLRSLKFSIADLPGVHLGEARGNQIRVDENAGGNGRNAGDRVASDRMDLLTAIIHEMGHALGLDDTYREADRENVMYGFLTKGERRLPAKNQAAGVFSNETSATHFLSTPLNIGDLPAGKTVTITYKVTINSAAT